MQGWLRPTGAVKAHYFVLGDDVDEGASLCGSWKVTRETVAVTPLDDEANDRSKRNCATCAKKLRPRRKREDEAEDAEAEGVETVTA